MNTVQKTLLILAISSFCVNAENRTYQVKLGDTLSSIARQQKVSVAQLLKWNKLSEADVLEVGQQLIVQAKNSVQPRSISTKAINKYSADELQALAKKAFAAQNYGKALTALKRLQKIGNDEQQAFALEYIAVIRERNGQTIFAKQLYQQYLTKFANNKNAKRVKMRLNSLLGAERLSKVQTLKQSNNKKRQPSSFHRGSLGTDYRRSILVDDTGNQRDTMSLADLDIDAKGQVVGNTLDVNYRVSVGRYQDLLPDARKSNNQIRYLYTKLTSKNNDYQFSIGRQRSRAKGIFGRFDGAVGSMTLFDDDKLNVFAGYPVASSKVTSLDPERKFYGVSYDAKNLLSGLDLSLFFFNQTINQLTDRRAIGGELSYFQSGLSLQGLFDYDIFFNELNAALTSGSYTSKTNKRLSWYVNYRKSPYIGTRNALIGQPVDSLAELKNLFITDEEILDLAVDRTLSSKSASIQYAQPLNKMWDINTSFTWMNISGAPESGGVAAISESGAQFYTNVNLGAKNLFSKRDYTRFGARYSKLSTSKVSSLYVSSKINMSNAWSFVPKLRFDNRTSDNGNTMKNLSPSLRVQFQQKSHYFYGDVGAILYKNGSANQADLTTNVYYFYVGYRYFFN